MFCTKCGTQLEDSAKFCTSCGTQVSIDKKTSSAESGVFNQISDSLPEENSQSNSKRKRPSFIVILGGGFLLVVGALVLTYSLNNPDIKLVKNGNFQACPSITVDQAVNSFLSNPKWESGVTNSQEHIVNIKGDLSFANKPVEGAIQFLISKNGNSFEFNALEFNGVPQSTLIGIGLIQKMCEAGVAKYGTNSNIQSIQPAKKEVISNAEQPPVPSSTQTPFGNYERQVDGKSDSNSAEISVVDAGNGMLKIKGDSTWVGDAASGNVNTGEIESVVPVQGNSAHYKDENDCSFDIEFAATGLIVKNDNGSCGGLNVTFNGNYTKTK
jgi:hypothetical protein